MAATASPLACRRVLVLALGIFLTGCSPDDATGSRQVESLRSELEEARRRISALQQTVANKDQELLTTTTAYESTKATLAEKDHALAERDKELKAAQTTLDGLKKNEAVVFAEIRAQQMQGQSAQALSRYYQFIKDYPKSPLAGVAGMLAGEINAPKTEAARPGTGGASTAAYVDPKKRERDFQKSFQEGYLTMQEIAPFVRKKSMPQIVALLGNPNQTFNSGTELGYADKAVNPVTGSRGMLIVGFEDGVVASLRVEYAGRKITP